MSTHQKTYSVIHSSFQALQNRASKIDCKEKYLALSFLTATLRAALSLERIRTLLVLTNALADLVLLALAHPHVVRHADALAQTPGAPSCTSTQTNECTQAHM